MNAPTPAKALAPATPATPATLQATAHLVELIPLGQITPSPTNPRKRIDQGKLEELAATIREQGVLEPILVRFKPGRVSGAGHEPAYELVAGERRWRASQLAGFADIPAMVRDLTDEAVLLIQVIENNQREDVHPLEEAEGYQRLMAAPHNMTADAIAGKIGRSRRYVFNRLKLLDLNKAARDAFFEGKVDLSIAQLIARVPADLQQDALDRIEQGDYNQVTTDRQPLTARQAAAYIESNFMLTLVKAPFDIKVTDYCAEGKIQPIAGACGTCPKRTGANPDLFNDVKSADTCTDPGCFQAKRLAEGARKVAKLVAAGKTVITGAEAKKIAPHGAQSTYLDGGYVHERDSTYETGTNRRWSALMQGEGAPEPVLIQHPESGDIFKAFKKSEAMKFLKANMADIKKEQAKGKEQPAAKRDPKAEAARRAAEITEKARAEIFTAAHTAMKAAIAKCGGLPHIEDVRMVADALIGGDVYGNGQLEVLWNVPKHKGISTIIPTLAPADLMLLMFDACLVDHIETMYHKRDMDPLLLAAARLRVDCIAIESRIKAEFAAKDKAEAEAAAAKAAKAAPAAPAAKTKVPGAKAGKKVTLSFMKPVQPSALLAAVIGDKVMPRTEITSKIWAYIKKNGLQDKINKRMVNTDELLRPVMGGKNQVSMFEMTKLLDGHLK